MGGMERIKGERSERQSDGVETHVQNRLYLSRFDIERVRFFIKMLYADIQNCASCMSGEHIFRKMIKQVARKLKNGAERP